MKMQGTVKVWLERGFGFITPDDVGPDVFVHFSALANGEALLPGARVEFDLGENSNNGKTCALNVAVLNAGEA